MNDYEPLSRVLMIIHAQTIYDMCVARNRNCINCPFCQYHDTEDPNWCAINKPYDWRLEK